MDYHYTVLESVIEGRKIYGIAAVTDTDSITSILYSFSDIGTDHSRILAMVELCNTHKLSLIHFSDVINDFIAGI